jgi:hypothetical protein
MICSPRGETTIRTSSAKETRGNQKLRMQGCSHCSSLDATQTQRHTHERYYKLKISSLLLILSAAVVTTPFYAQQANSSMSARSEGYQVSEALSPDQQAVLEPLELMCTGLVKKDAKLIQDQLLPGGMATQIREGRPVQVHFDFFDARLQKLFETSHDRFEETLYHPSVQIDHDIAVIWAPYVFTVNSKMDHCGTNVFTMYRQNGRWLVSNVADNGRQDACPTN